MWEDVSGGRAEDHAVQPTTTTEAGARGVAAPVGASIVAIIEIVGLQLA